MSRTKIETALKGLVFGYPTYGLDSLVSGYNKYKGPNHCSGIKLNGKYFLVTPNPYYSDVIIEQNRLDILPMERSEIEGIPIVHLSETNTDEQDKGPAENQFDQLDPNKEIASWSGIVTPLAPQDFDDKIKHMLKKFLGDDQDMLQQVIKQGNIASTCFNQNKRDTPIRELSTPGFFTMAYPHIFVNGTCDITITQ